MDNLDELFDGMPEPDAGLDFVIDESKRLIAVPEEGVVLGVEGDKDVNRIRLRINRYYRGSDLADFAIRVNYENAEGDRNYFTVTEKTVTEQTITFIWVVAADAVAYKGAVHFAVSFYCDSAAERNGKTTREGDGAGIRLQRQPWDLRAECGRIRHLEGTDDTGVLARDVQQSLRLDTGNRRTCGCSGSSDRQPWKRRLYL